MANKEHADEGDAPVVRKNNLLAEKKRESSPADRPINTERDY
jgi:hypothetical protein